MKTKSIVLFFLFISNGCQNGTVVPHTDPGLTRSGEFLFHHGKKFDGVLETKLDAIQVVRKTSYREGLPDGIEKEMYQNRILSSERNFTRGKKTGIHRGWYPDGKRRFQYSYQNGELHGDVWEWHSSGSLITYAKYWNGQLLGKKVWRPDGQIYANFVMQSGRPMGLPGSKLCWQVRSDENEKTKSF
ncbi:hypothetical protein EHQ12_06830 [Leptospira gomenensis]|uniref:Toxin-antitoxin system YwqK family antitoxin n=1 Tax=Leptospira gomenensis TaxID=2484974 RepID=A0A5F1YG49_9LEPT|nr:hypothetical protein [Leptospira gomenensis]TGK37436.1 hypothetical protein EHQ17_02455 [Leptospira gomenensis]TGK40795.1 hypothetical protein EHQ12_06830 [Leptospira gomenensis]TGK43021.1 hypothetical protein EHQ07_12750 [Leptospira gomenensis]TGK54279.1 hypothetical protein EHQ13_19605 [Leptospira gomenensis]